MRKTSAAARRGKYAANKERQRKQLERNRLRGFLELASRWEGVETARLFLDALANRAAAEVLDDRTIGEWIIWARELLNAHDPLEAGAAACAPLLVP
jgi:hypothetical protein